MHTSCQSMHPSYRQELWGTRWGVGIGGGEGVRCVPAPGHLNDRSDQLADFISSMVERHIRCAQAVKQGACPRAPCATATAGWRSWVRLAPRTVSSYAAWRLARAIYIGPREPWGPDAWCATDG